MAFKEWIADRHRATSQWTTAIKQQKLQARKPALTPKFVFQLVFVTGFLCISIGISLTTAANSIIEIPREYEGTGTKVSINFEIKEIINETVYIYYQLDNYQQNYRLMLKSYDEEHYLNCDYSFKCNGETNDGLLGRPFLNLMNSLLCPSNNDTSSEPSRLCSIFRLFKTAVRPNWNSSEPVPVPCGNLAGAMFNDRLIDFYDSEETSITLSDQDISWGYEMDKDDARKIFRNPPNFDNVNDEENCLLFDKYVAEKHYSVKKPDSWSKRICEMPGGMQNEDFLVWMRPAARPSFRKLWKKVEGGLRAGNYTITIESNFETNRTYFYDGTYGGNFPVVKSVVISTANWAGGKNNFLGVAYLVVGVIVIFTGFALYFIHVNFGNQLQVERKGKWCD